MLLLRRKAEGEAKMWKVVFGVLSFYLIVPSSLCTDAGDKASLCGDVSVTSKRITLYNDDSQIHVSRGQTCSCDVIPADRDVVTMAISVNTNYTQSCRALHLQFNSSAVIPVQCRSRFQSLPEPFALPPLSLTSLGVRLDFATTLGPMAITVQASTALTARCGDPARITSTTTSTPPTSQKPSVSSKTPPVSPATTVQPSGGATMTLTSSELSNGSSTISNGSCDVNRTASLFSKDDKVSDEGEVTARALLACLLIVGVLVVALAVTVVYLRRTKKLCFQSEVPAEETVKQRKQSDLAYLRRYREDPELQLPDRDANFILRDGGIQSSPSFNLSSSDLDRRSRSADDRLKENTSKSRERETTMVVVYNEGEKNGRNVKFAGGDQILTMADVHRRASERDSIAKKSEDAKTPGEKVQHYSSVDIIDGKTIVDANLDLDSESSAKRSSTKLSPHLKMEYDKLRQSPKQSESSKLRYNHISLGDGLSDTEAAKSDEGRTKISPKAPERKNRESRKVAGTESKTVVGKESKNVGKTENVAATLLDKSKFVSKDISGRTLQNFSVKFSSPKSFDKSGSLSQGDSAHDSPRVAKSILQKPNSLYTPVDTSRLKSSESSKPSGHIPTDVPPERSEESWPPVPDFVLQDIGLDVDPEEDWKDRVLTSQILVVQGHYQVPKPSTDETVQEDINGNPKGTSTTKVMRPHKV